MAEALLGYPATTGNRVDLLRNGVEIFPALLSELQRAERSIDFTCYVVDGDRVAEQVVRTLLERAEAGVRVRLLLDPLGARAIDRSWSKLLTASGVDVSWYRLDAGFRLWEQNHRNHRRIIVCDERVAITGGFGLAERWDGDARTPDEWRDTAVRVEGPAVVGLRASFLAGWATAGGSPLDVADVLADPGTPGDVTVLPWRGAGGPGWNDTASVWAALLGTARRRLRITTPYFAPDERFLGLLEAVAERDVEVQLLLPGPHADQEVLQRAAEASFDRLLAAGVSIHRYQPTMVHAKVVTTDGEAALVGTPNFDARSLSRNDEVGVLVFDEDVVGRLDADTDDDLARSEPVDPERWAERGVARRAREAAVGLIDGEL
ncbi:phospholipase D-like domain-containing protein [soil metagenome]